MTDWPMSRFALSRDGFNPFEFGLNRGNVRGLRWQWAADVGGVDWQATAPTVAGDRVYVGSGSVRDYRGSGALYALDDDSGHVVWRVPLDGSPVEPSPTVVRDVLLVSVTDASANSTLHGFSAVDGTSRWVTPVGSVPSSAVVVDGVAYVVTAGSSPAMFAVAVSDGARRWRVDLPGSVEGSAPAVADGMVFVVTADGAVVALDVTDGRVRWQVPLAGVVHRGPAVVDGRVHVGDDHGDLVAFDAGSGATLWRTVIPAGEMGIAVAYGLVYVAKGSVDGDSPALLAIDAATGGDPRWTTFHGTAISGPTVAGGVVYVGGTTGRLYGVDAVSGAHVWNPQEVVVNQTTNFDEIVVRNAALYTSNLDGSNGFVVKYTLPFRPLSRWWWSKYRFRPQRIPIGDPPPRPVAQQRQASATR